MMLARDVLALSIHNLLLHKFRSFLTSLGVIFGVGSVIAMLAISEGAKRAALEQIEAMGIDKIIIYSQKPLIDGKSDGGSTSSVVESYGLTDKDVFHISNMDNVDRISTLTNTRKKVLKGLNRTDLKLIGIDYTFLEDSNSQMVDGRYFSAMDFRDKHNVCVIGTNVKRKLFQLGETNIVGSNLRIENQVYKIIGIFHNEYGSQYPEIGAQNDMILIPESTAEATYNNYAFWREGRAWRIVKVENDVLIVKVEELMHIDDTSKRISNYLSKSHENLQDWGMIVPLELLKQREQTQNIFTIVMSSIAAISLVVGGIGIMNIMLASVFERRKEIGTRRALGAQKIDIILQFLLETVFLTTSGGVMGILAGIGIAKIITHYSGMPTIYSTWSILASLIISSLVGIIFGTYPAYKAAQQNPINVLRGE
ncbi:MAG: ABC transporter permease [Lentisphaeria bacterium]|nr:ABC transporter permease [Lentisphaeria bacterium]